MSDVTGVSEPHLRGRSFPRLVFGSSLDEASRVRRAAIFVFGTALGVRILFLAVAPTPPIEDDAALYHGVATSLASGEGYTLHGEAFAGREPGYILVVAGTYAVFGAEPVAVHLLQALVGSGTAVVTLIAASRMWRPEVGVVAGLVAALSPWALGYTNLVLTETLATFWFALILLVVAGLIRSPSWLSAASAGLLIGVTSLTRTNFLILIPLIPLLLRIGRVRWGHALRFGGIAAFIALAAYAPWVLRNALVMDAFIPTRLGMGAIVWSGSYVPWEGQWLGHIPPLTAFQAGLSPVDADRRMWREAFGNMKSDPLGVARIWALKPFRVWLPADNSLVRENPLARADVLSIEPADVGRAFARSPLAVSCLIVSQLAWGLCLVLAALGVLWNRRHPGAHLALALLVLGTLILLPGNPQPRYVTPLSPAMFGLVGVGAMEAIRFWKALGGRSETPRGEELPGQAGLG
jgi:4-amino-4-deoxy-L-arabinose transferase-like glycosyltransferase